MASDISDPSIGIPKDLETSRSDPREPLIATPKALESQPSMISSMSLSSPKSLCSGLQTSQSSRNEELDQQFQWVLEVEWAYDKDAANFMAIELSKKDWVPVGSVVGPAVPWAFGLLAYVWISFLVMPYIGMWLTPCPSAGQMVASYPTWIWIFGFPFFIGCIFMELKVLKYAILPLFHQCWANASENSQKARPDTHGALSVGGYDHHIKGTFKTWLASMGFVSFVNHLSIISNGLFLVKVLKAQQCAAHPDFQASSLYDMWKAGWDANTSDTEMNIIWQAVMSRSSMRHLPVLGSIITDVSFVQIVFAVWALMLLQPLYALVTAVPIEFVRCQRGPDYKIGWSHKRHHKVTDQMSKDSSESSLMKSLKSSMSSLDEPLKLQYRTMTWRKHNHAQALFHVAEGARMASVCALRLRALSNYLKRRMDDKKEFKIGHEELNVLRSINAAALARYVLIGLLENSAMLNIQITTVAMFAFVHDEVGSETSAWNHGMHHWQMYVSVIAALAIGLWKVGDACMLMTAAWRELTSSRLQTLKTNDDFHRRRNFLRFEILVVMICVAGFLVSMFLAVSKLVMLYICPDNFWNFSWSLNQMKGCVNMSDEFDNWQGNFSNSTLVRNLNRSRWDSPNSTLALRYPQ